MKRFFIPVILMLSVCFSCSKTKTTVQEEAPCVYANDSTIAVVEVRPATVTLIGSYYTLQLNSSDTILNACNLPENFKADKLSVTISGDVKATIHNAWDPCKCYQFVIRSISR